MLGSSKEQWALSQISHLWEVSVKQENPEAQDKDLPRLLVEYFSFEKITPSHVPKQQQGSWCI